jgi:hypothetical protein
MLETIIPEVLEGHIFQQRRVPHDKVPPFIPVYLSIMLCICFLKGLLNIIRQTFIKSQFEWMQNEILYKLKG